jgi:TRAP-type mannitol/chloroaromatic compound transport system permease large subunit
LPATGRCTPSFIAVISPLSLRLCVHTDLVGAPFSSVATHVGHIKGGLATATIVGVAGMIYGAATGMLIVVNREPDE